MKKQNKEEKRKPKYGFFSCVAYSLGLTWKAQKSIAISAIAVIPLSLILSTIGLYLPSMIIEKLEVKEDFQNIIIAIAAIFGAQLVFSIARNYVNTKRSDAEHHILLKMIYDQNVRYRDMDYYLQFDIHNQEIMKRANNACRNNHTAGVHFIEYFSNIITNILSFLLFGAVVAMLNPLILILLIVGCLINYYMALWQSKRNWRNQKERSTISKKLNYISWSVSSNLGYGKDIRLFSLGDFLDDLIFRLENNYYDEQRKVERNVFIASLVNFIVVLVRDGVAYAFLIIQATRGEITSAEFVLYFSAITSLSGFISGVLNLWAKMQDGALSVSDYREFFDIKDKLNRGEGIHIDRGIPLSVEFKNVSYKYPKGDKKILDNVSFKINAGERVALVGSNGAGKTTLTMLMCGLLIPDEGEVLIGGHSVFEYNRDELYTFFSLVPQNYSLLPFTIAENISLANTEAGEKIDYDKIQKCIKEVGLEDKINSLPLGVDTPLDRQVHANATDLSSGEKQKLLLARALYRDAEILILDEPTAALDPIAEDQMYQKYNDFSKNATSIFISHRLASTRFCDRIFFLDEAKICEEGTHNELIELGGKYRELFDIQAKYYKEDAKHE